MNVDDTAVMLTMHSKILNVFRFELVCMITKFGPKLHISTVKISIDSGLDQASSSIIFVVVKSIFRTYMRCFVSHCIVQWDGFKNISETIAGYRWNRSPLLTELTFCHKSSMNISMVIDIAIDLFTSEDRYSLWITTAPLGVYNPDHIWYRTCACRCYTREAPVTQTATGVGSSLLHSSIPLLFRQPITSPMIVFTSSPTYLLVQTQLQSIRWPWNTDISFSALPTSNPPFIVVGCYDCRWLRNGSRKYVA